MALSHHLLTTILLGAAIGAIHGTTRAVGVLKNHKDLRDSSSELLILGEIFRWRFLDGTLLLLAAGILVGYLLKGGIPSF